MALNDGGYTIIRQKANGLWPHPNIIFELTDPTLMHSLSMSKSGEYCVYVNMQDKAIKLAEASNKFDVRKVLYRGTEAVAYHAVSMYSLRIRPRHRR